MTTELETEQRLDNLKFRLKTREEFIEEFGKNWRVFILSGWESPEMDHLFNYKLSKKDNLELFQVFIGVRNDFIIKDDIGTTWHVDKTMMVLNK